MHFRSKGVDPGRDGCRVPLPWSGQHPPFGFSPPADTDQVEPWIPQPSGWAGYTVEAQSHDPGSMLSLYRTMLRIRRAEAGLRGNEFRFLDSPDGVLQFVRGDGFVSVTNLSSADIALPPHDLLLLSSAELVNGKLPPDSTAWLHTQHDPQENQNTQPNE
jgi:alpha-glucosidase